MEIMLAKVQDSTRDPIDIKINRLRMTLCQRLASLKRLLLNIPSYKRTLYLENIKMEMFVWLLEYGLIMDG